LGYQPEKNSENKTIAAAEDIFGILKTKQIAGPILLHCYTLANPLILNDPYYL